MGTAAVVGLWVLAGMTGVGQEPGGLQAASELQNGEFDRDLDGWLVFAAEADHARFRGGVRSGGAEWSPEYGGSCKVVVSGAPSSVDLQQTLRAYLPKGSTLIIEVVYAVGDGKGLTVFLGGYDVERILDEADTQNRNIVRYVTQRDYFRGTPVNLHFAVWPGTRVFFIKSIRLLKPLDRDSNAGHPLRSGYLMPSERYDWRWDPPSAVAWYRQAVHLRTCGDLHNWTSSQRALLCIIS
jgi:hypothetical protein